MVGEISNERSTKAINEDIERLREWLMKQPHLPHNVEEEILSAFVQGTKTLEIAKRKLDNYYSGRSRAPKLYDITLRDASLSTFKEHSKASNHFFLPKLTPDGSIVILSSLTEIFDKYFDHPFEIIRMLMLLELGLRKWPNARSYIMVMDLKGAPANLVAKLAPTLLATSLSCFQDGYPMKFTAGFFINSPPVMEFIINNLVKPFLSEKLFSRIKVTSEGISAVHTLIPEEILPSNYGGKEKSSSDLNEYWMGILEDNRDWFEFTSNQKSDELKRPPDEKNTYGIEGTFRKLAVD